MDKRKEADKLYKEAVKLTTPSLLSFRMRGEWEQATPLLERAAMLYKVGQLFEQPVSSGGASVADTALPASFAHPVPAYAMCSNVATWGVPRNVGSVPEWGRSGRRADGMQRKTWRRLVKQPRSLESGQTWKRTTAAPQSCMRRRGACRRRQRRRHAAHVRWKSDSQRWVRGAACSEASALTVSV
jgi:hypothetical protein